MSVTVVSCLYGDGFDRFVGRWWTAFHDLDPAPDGAKVMSDKWRFYDSLPACAPCPWKHPQAFYLQQAIEAADTDWVVIADIDDLLMPDALAGLEDVAADVWALGFERSDGETYIPPPMTAADVLAAPTSIVPGSSAIRVEAFHAAGGFRDVAFQDWALWRALARNGATFESSGRTHFRYMRHEATRGATELTDAARADHLTEMMEAEARSEGKRMADYYVRNYAVPR